jgi:type VI secretion system protein VasG
MPVNVEALIEKLNETTRNASEAAAGLCHARTHYDVEIEHYLIKLLQERDSDFAPIMRAFSIDESRLTKELNVSLDRLKTGNARGPTLSPSFVRMLTEAWTMGSLDFRAEEVRSGFTILALTADAELQRVMRDFSHELRKINAEALKKDFVTIVKGTRESLSTRSYESSDAKAGSVGSDRPAHSTKTPFLDQYTHDLTQAARKGKIDPVLARDPEIRQLVDILTRRRQNNPILVGEAGVGKTAVVEGFAIRVANGDVPPVLKDITVRGLDLALLQAGAGIKGEFENRLKGLINEVKSSPKPIVLFIDEAHTMIGAGGAAGQGDAANLLKPALARGELRTIAATTWSEYKKYFEQDAALTRRFQPVKVEEPSEEQCCVMVRGIVPSLEQHHNVRILDDGIASAVRLSHRYLPERQLPDKAISVLDTACARLALGQNATPAAVEAATRTLDDIEVQTRVLEREQAVGTDHTERLRQLAEQRRIVKDQLETLTLRWTQESDLVVKIREIRTLLEQQADNSKSSQPAQPAAEAPSQTLDPKVLRADLDRLNRELEELQGESPLIRVCVDGSIVGEVISAWTGVPVGKMLRDEVETVLNLESHLGKRVIGQGHALTSISQRIRTARARLDDPGKPVGVFMLVGPSGVGKTETALALADLLYGGERNLVTLNMSEFQEPHSVATLKGAPPGYVGYGEGGVLTEAVRRRPYSVVLLDEVEKAHPDVLELFFQVFDKGTMEDGEGRVIDFKNTIIILTSNAGTDSLMKLVADPETAPSPAGLVSALKPELNKIFKPAFLGRLVVVPYFPVRDEILKQITVLKLGKIVRRLKDTHRIAFEYSPALLDEIVKRCTEVESGARNVDNILTNTLLPDISRRILTQLAAGEAGHSIRVAVGDDGSFVYS